ncbi:T9SS type B sorting domain-containing protein [Flavobacterium sp. LS1P3]|uniref:T9SS type B sorting domain-containing protein n=1 Tax=Flavobacterium sp. LS1P3 TaxID=3401720 RepID=UPI003AB06DB4
MKTLYFFRLILVVLLLSCKIVHSTNSIRSSGKVTISCTNNKINHRSFPLLKEIKTSSTNTILPIITATGDQVYCPHASMNIVTDITITDPDDISTDAIYIQISSGYNYSQDLLTLNGSHPTINPNWDLATGRLTLTSSTPGIPVTYVDFVKAIKDIVYTNSSNLPTGNRTFSISTDKLSYLASNQHFYEFVPSIGIAPNSGIDWGLANDLANAKTYHGLKGYLVTILSADENQIAATQQTGTGWIGGSDTAEEGVWKWMTGPEKGTTFFYNLESTPAPGVYASNPNGIGSTTNYANWNRSSTNWYNGIPYYEPDNIYNLFRVDEDYAIIIDNNSKGTQGSWNDINYNGESFGGSQQANGFIVEYGGMPNDPEIHIATSTSITIPQITSTTESATCGPGSLTLQATSNLGTINWFENETELVPLATGPNFTTPIISKSTTYYIDTEYGLCEKYSTRTPVTATIYNTPIVTTTNSRFTLCGPGSIILDAKTTEGTIYWYSELTGNNLIAVGTSITRDITTNTTFYVEAINKNCTTGTRVPVEVVVYKLPTIPDEKLVICHSKKLTIDAKISETGMTYLWSTGEKNQTIEISKAGTYTVDITRTAPESCTVRKTITVIENPAPVIESISVDETTVTIILKNPDIYYEYSTDGINYQLSNVFLNSLAGLQTAYVREIDLCSYDTQNFIVLIVPQFFTPNNDSYNDVWEVKGLINYPEAEVTIFDRYGKLITTLSTTNQFWDGTFNKDLLPASDYWYVLKIDNTRPVMKGHFSLKR